MGKLSRLHPPQAPKDLADILRKVYDDLNDIRHTTEGTNRDTLDSEGRAGDLKVYYDDKNKCNVIEGKSDKERGIIKMQNKATYNKPTGDRITESTLGKSGVGTTTPDTNLEVAGSFAANGPSSTFVSMSSGDTSPDVSAGNIFKTHADGVTINQFDNGICGQIITIISGGATVYDVTSSELKGGTADITTAAGDVTMWVCESATIWHLLSWMDASANLADQGDSGF